MKALRRSGCILLVAFLLQFVLTLQARAQEKVFVHLNPNTLVFNAQGSFPFMKATVGINLVGYTVTGFSIDLSVAGTVVAPALTFRPTVAGNWEATFDRNVVLDYARAAGLAGSTVQARVDGTLTLRNPADGTVVTRAFWGTDVLEFLKPGKR